MAVVAITHKRPNIRYTQLNTNYMYNYAAKAITSNIISETSSLSCRSLQFVTDSKMYRFFH